MYLCSYYEDAIGKGVINQSSICGDLFYTEISFQMTNTTQHFNGYNYLVVQGFLSAEMGEISFDIIGETYAFGLSSNNGTFWLIVYYGWSFLAISVLLYSCY